MRVALAVNLVTPDLEANLADMERLVRGAAAGAADLVLFPEAAPTGAINNDDPAHDLPLGEPVPGPIVNRFSALARDYALHIGTGILERAGDALYSSFVLLAPNGDLILKYRRISPGWHGRRADPAVYRHGEAIPVVATPFGRVACLICGDLFHSDLAQRVAAAKPDWLLFPFTRNYEDNSWDDERWRREDEPVYCERARSVGATVLMVGYLAEPGWSEDSSFGGAFVISPRGQVIARKPLGEAGLLLVDLPRPNCS